MKLIYQTLLLTVLYSGTHFFEKALTDWRYERLSSTTVAYSENKSACKITAAYPIEKSQAVISYMNRWCAPAVQRLGRLPGTLKVKFADGLTCKVEAKGGNLEIVATRTENGKAALSRFKSSCNAIQDFILKQAAD